jgi:hypothetical protein
MSADSAREVRPPITGRRAVHTGLAAARTAFAVTVSAALVCGMTWVTLGRLAAVWPVRNVFEAQLRGLVRDMFGEPTPDERPPGSIVGRVTWRVTEGATPLTPSLAVMLTPTPSSRGSAPTPTPTVAPPVGSQIEGGGEVSGAYARPKAREVPVPGALVLVVDGEGNAVEARTDASGEYSLSGLYPGRYRVVATAPGFAPVVVDRVPDGSLAGQLLAWLAPGVWVPPNGATTLAISVERPSPPPLSAFGRDVLLPRGAAASTAPDLVACNASESTSMQPERTARRLPVGLTGALTDAPVASLRRYGSPIHADETGPVTGTRRVEPSPAVLAVVPVGSEEDACAAISLAHHGVEVVVAGIAPVGAPERQVIAVRALLASLRAESVSSMARGPVVVGTGFATTIVMRAAADEAADVPMDWTGVAVSGRTVTGSDAAERLALRRAKVASRIGGIVLVAPVLDLFAVRREAATLGLSPWLAEAVAGLGPADRELSRYVRFSARFASDLALPPVLVVRGGQKTAAIEGPIDEWARVLGSAGVSVAVVGSAEIAPWEDELATSALVDRVTAMAGAPRVSPP